MVEPHEDSSSLLAAEEECSVGLPERNCRALFAARGGTKIGDESQKRKLRSVLAPAAAKRIGKSGVMTDTLFATSGRNPEGRWRVGFDYDMLRHETGRSGPGSPERNPPQGSSESGGADGRRATRVGWCRHEIRKGVGLARSATMGARAEDRQAGRKVGEKVFGGRLRRPN